MNGPLSWIAITLLLVACIFSLAGCQSARDTAPGTIPGVVTLDREAIRAELAPLLDLTEDALRYRGETELADQARQARETARQILDRMDTIGDGELQVSLVELDQTARSLIDAWPDDGQRLMARGAYLVARLAIRRAGVALPASE